MRTAVTFSAAQPAKLNNQGFVENFKPNWAVIEGETVGEIVAKINDNIANAFRDQDFVGHVVEVRPQTRIQLIEAETSLSVEIGLANGEVITSPIFSSFNDLTPDQQEKIRLLALRDTIRDALQSLSVPENAQLKDIRGL